MGDMSGSRTSCKSACLRHLGTGRRSLEHLFQAIVIGGAAGLLERVHPHR